jgi:hypothetical protein
VSASGTGCNWSAASIHCALDPLASGATQTVFVTLQAGAAGSYPTTATVASQQPDPSLPNNTTAYTFVVK